MLTETHILPIVSNNLWNMMEIIAKRSHKTLKLHKKIAMSSHNDGTTAFIKPPNTTIPNVSWCFSLFILIKVLVIIFIVLCMYVCMLCFFLVGIIRPPKTRTTAEQNLQRRKANSSSHFCETKKRNNISRNTTKVK